MTKARTCGRKIRHAYKLDAEEHLNSLIREGDARPGSMNVYRCPYCNGWHVGHRKHVRR
jgi:hypothetical protein